MSLTIFQANHLLLSSGSRPDLALAGTDRHQGVVSPQNQSLTRITVWHHLALAGISKRLVPFFNGIDHGISGPGSTEERQYHAFPAELFMVSGIILE